MKLRNIALAACVVMLVGVTGPSSAIGFFDAEVEHVNFSGNNTTNMTFTTSVGTVQCKKTSLQGTAIGSFNGSGYTASSVVGHPVISECTAFGFPATVTTTGCEYRYTRTGTSGGVPIGPLHIECEAGKTIKVVAAGFCTMEIGTQTPTGHTAYRASGSGSTRDIAAEATLTGIVYGGNCGSGKNGTVTGNVTVKGFDTAGQQKGLWVT